MSKERLQERVADILSLDLGNIKKGEDLPIDMFIRQAQETAWIYKSIVPRGLFDRVFRLSVDSSITELTGTARELYGACMNQITTDRPSVIRIAKDIALTVKASTSEDTRRQAFLMAQLLTAFIDNAD